MAFNFSFILRRRNSSCITYRPNKLNRKSHYVIDKFSGKDALNYRLKKLNIDISEKELIKLLIAIKSKPEINRWTDEKLVSLYDQIYKKSDFDIVS